MDARYQGATTMSATGNTGFDSSRQEGILWIKEITDGLQLKDSQDAYYALRAVLQALRDRLTEKEAVKLGSHLPMLVRRIYFEEWRPAAKPLDEPHLAQFLMQVSKELTGRGPQDPMRITRGVLRVLGHHIAPEEIAEIKRSLPAEVRELWPAESAATEGRHPDAHPRR
ncbi:MAG: DUF2267 domain-containing protein [Actinobacteria bacterium]|nr:DUF2267 domain-containing protein [Actinomycetota bacterium]